MPAQKRVIVMSDRELCYFFPAKIVASSTPPPPPRRLDIHFFVFISQLKEYRQLTISLEIKVELHSLNIPTTNKPA